MKKTIGIILLISILAVAGCQKNEDNVVKENQPKQSDKKKEEKEVDNGPLLGIKKVEKYIPKDWKKDKENSNKKEEFGTRYEYVKDKKVIQIFVSNSREEVVKNKEKIDELNKKKKDNVYTASYLNVLVNVKAKEVTYKEKTVASKIIEQLSEEK